MQLSEFDIIQQFFQKAPLRSDVVLGIGDDCAILSPPPNENLLVSTDTLTQNIHFFSNANPFDLGYKAAAISLSDIAAMGGKPAWALLSLTLPTVEEKWLASFSEGLFSLLDLFEVTLVGGNTSKGPLSITTQILGFTQNSVALRRSGAKVGDAIYVTGTLGDSGLALQIQQNKIQKDFFANSDLTFINTRLNRPTPRITQGLALAGIATAAIDISDGLAADLQHLLSASGVGATVYTDQLPLSEVLAQHTQPPNSYQIALTAGEDYELCFTLPPSNMPLLERVSASFQCPITCIGKIEEEEGLRITLPDGQLFPLRKKGYQHF